MSAVEHRQYESNGVHLHAVTAGPESGPVIIFLHGFPEFWYSWRKQILHFARAGYRVIVPDQRGYNLSDKPAEIRDYSITKLAADISAIIDTVRWHQVTLVGHDWGGTVAFWTARRRPERVGRLVVINGPHFQAMHTELRRNVKQMLASRYIAYMQMPWLPETMLKQGGYSRLVKAMSRSSRKGTFSKDEFEHYRKAWAQPGALPSMINWYRAAWRDRALPVTDHTVPVSTLLLWGEKDRFLRPEIAEASLAYCPHGRLETFPDATHWLHHEEPERVNSMIEEFVGG